MECPLDAAPILDRDGANIARVIFELDQKMHRTKDFISQYMGIISPGIERVDCIEMPTGSKNLILRFLEGSPPHHIFHARQVSRGTLTCLGLFTALLQNSERSATQTPFIGLEGVGDGLHLKALAAVIECVKSVSEYSQVIASSHSTDLLDDKKILAESILPVAKTVQGTKIGTVSEAARSAIKNRLFTAGELLRVNALNLEVEGNPSSGEVLEVVTGTEGSPRHNCK